VTKIKEFSRTKKERSCFFK